MIGRSLWGSSICHTMGLENRIPVENLPQSQALDSATFRPPPLDGSLEAAELYDWHRSNNTEHTLFVYSQQDGNIRTIRWPEAVDAIHVGAKFVRKVTNWVPGMTETPVVGMVVASAPEERPRLVQMPLFEELYGQPPVDPQDVVYEKRGLDSRIAYLHSSGSTSFPKPIPFSSRRFIEIALATECDVVVSVPSVIEAWSSNSEYVEWLATRTGVMFAGGALSKSAGDYLVSKGVRTMNLYGTTETGGISKVVPDDDTEWEYFRLSEAVVPELDPQGDGTYELILMPGPVSNLILSNTTVRGIPAYATSDLLIPHPTKPHLYKIYGRKDDQIIHSTGEKTNPTPLEAILNHDTRIKSAVLFGTGRFQVGVLIDPEPGLLPAGDERALEEFKSAIWPSIQKMNEYAPQHSRLFKEMIILSKPSKPFTYTAKGTARRQAVIRDYQEEIDELYEATGSSSLLSVEVELPVVWSYGNTLDLQATNIRNVLLRGLRDGAKVDTLSLGKGNLVYTAPTISSLADLMMRTIDHKPLPPSVNSSLSTRVEKMMQMADHYSHFSPSESVAALPLHLTQPRGQTAGRVVLLTGTTGALGSYILEVLLKDKSVGKVYALNRRRRSSSATTILDRQKKVFQEKGLDVAILDAASGRLELLEGELSRPDFGLSKDVLGEVVSSVTTIIHNAWPVDFKFSLKSFEPMIKGLGNLISFSLASPLRPTVLFASTFAVLQNATPSPTPYQEVEIPPEYAIGTGYTESKWVAEELLSRASRDMGLRSLVVRVGQITGGNNGTWKPEEWFPSLVMSSPDVGSFPDCDKNCSNTF
ncbi:ICS [Coprinopsis cinerea okayama7|uniref:ICS n=1 Tax=Coprinopsis cinerea (strain Okayama-7 / 130 / ATCC MYA-4618 / FGSC 9003) TaxID=240176 RepID=A8NHY2_COPC7|nr:ICS [Coprinopsis cinerea okayama7\|eukprot:XP_001833857.2 ICS [Coprinopsis cinerea okayama7\